MGLAPQLYTSRAAFCVPLLLPTLSLEKGRKGKRRLTGKHDQTRKRWPSRQETPVLPAPPPPTSAASGGMPINLFPSLSFLICSHIPLKEEGV